MPNADPQEDPPATCSVAPHDGAHVSDAEPTRSWPEGWIAILNCAPDSPTTAADVHSASSVWSDWPIGIFDAHGIEELVWWRLMNPRRTPERLRGPYGAPGLEGAHRVVILSHGNPEEIDWGTEDFFGDRPGINGRELGYKLLAAGFDGEVVDLWSCQGATEPSDEPECRTPNPSPTGCPEESVAEGVAAVTHRTAYGGQGWRTDDGAGSIAVSNGATSVQGGGVGRAGPPPPEWPGPPIAEGGPVNPWMPPRHSEDWTAR